MRRGRRATSRSRSCRHGQSRPQNWTTFKFASSQWPVVLGPVEPVGSHDRGTARRTSWMGVGRHRLEDRKLRGASSDSFGRGAIPRKYLSPARARGPVLGISSARISAGCDIEHGGPGGRHRCPTVGPTPRPATRRLQTRRNLTPNSETRSGGTGALPGTPGAGRARRDSERPPSRGFGAPPSDPSRGPCDLIDAEPKALEVAPGTAPA